MTPHPLAALFPLLEGEELQALADDIRKHGLREPILVLGDQVLDGRNRKHACELVGVEPRTEEYAGDPADIPVLIISKNLHRRHLTTDQRAAIAAELATMRLGDNQHVGSEGPPPGGPSPPKVSTATAAKLVNVGERTVERAKHRKRTDPEAHQAALRGGRMKRTRKPKVAASDAAPSSRTTGTYTNGQGYTVHYEVPKPGETKVEIAFLRHAPVPAVADWLVAALGTDRLRALLGAPGETGAAADQARRP